MYRAYIYTYLYYYLTHSYVLFNCSSQALDDSLVDDDQTQLPDILLLSPIQCSKAYFEDSLCMEDDTQLPIERAALPQDTAEDSTSSDKEKR